MGVRIFFSNLLLLDQIKMSLSFLYVVKSSSPTYYVYVRLIKATGVDPVKMEIRQLCKFSQLSFNLEKILRPKHLLEKIEESVPFSQSF